MPGIFFAFCANPQFYPIQEIIYWALLNTVHHTQHQNYKYVEPVPDTQFAVPEHQQYTQKILLPY